MNFIQNNKFKFLFCFEGILRTKLGIILFVRGLEFMYMNMFVRGVLNQVYLFKRSKILGPS